MLTPLYLAGLIRGLARNLGQVLDTKDHVVPFALTMLDDLLADDVIRLLGCLQRAHELHNRLSDAEISDMALADSSPEAGETPKLVAVTA